MADPEVTIGATLLETHIGDDDFGIDGGIKGSVTFGKNGYAGPTFSGGAEVNSTAGPFSSGVSASINEPDKLTRGGKLLGFGLSWNPDEISDFEVGFGPFSIGFAFPIDKPIYGGTTKYNYVPGVGLVVVGMDDTVIEDAVEMAEFRRDLYSSVKSNERTTEILLEVKKIANNQGVDAAREALIEGLAGLALDGVSVHNGAFPVMNELFREVFKRAAEMAIERGAYPDRVLRIVAELESSPSHEASSASSSEGNGFLRDGIRDIGAAVDDLLKKSGPVSGAIGGAIEAGANAVAYVVDAATKAYEAAYQKEYNRDRQDGGSASSSTGTTGGTGAGTTRSTSAGTSGTGTTSHNAANNRDRQGNGDHTATEGRRPILLDLDGDGVKITDFDKSAQFVAGKDGLSHRTSWAGAGDGVLFFDPDGRNAITEERQYVFTEWDPTATGDLEAIRSTFDSNGDGKLTAADADFAKFKMLVTHVDAMQGAA